MSKQVDLPSVGTNYQDQPLIELVYNSSVHVPAAFLNATNAPSDVVSAYLTLGQSLGFENGNRSAKWLRESVGERARNIVEAGGFVSEAGMEMILCEQAESIVERNSVSSCSSSGQCSSGNAD